MNRLLDRFAGWFASAGGVWQTFFVVMALVVLEFINPRLDPSGYWILFWLTVYSGLTQPALAYVAVRADKKTDAVLAHLEQLVDRGVSLDEEELRIIKSIASGK